MPFFLGHEVIAALSPQSRPAWRYSLAFCVGAGLISFWVFVLGVMRLPLTVMVVNIPIFGAAIWLFILRELKKCIKDRNRIQWLGRRVLDFRFWISISVFLNMLFIFVAAYAFQTYAWDSLSYIAFQAKVVFFERSFQYGHGLPHPSAPLGIPLFQFWLNLNLGYWSDYFIQLPFPMFFISLLAVVWSFLKEHVSSRAAWIALFLMLCANLPVYHATIGYADLPLSVYICSAILLVFESVKIQDERLLLIAGLCAALGAWTKLEGVVFLLIVYCLYVFLVWRSQESMRMGKFLKRTMFLGVFFVLVFGVHWIYKQRLGLLIFADRFRMLDLNEAVVRFKSFLLAAAQSLFYLVNWNVNWFLWIAVIVLTPFYKNRLSGYLFIGISLFWLAWSGCFILTNNFQYMTGVLSRAVLQFFPLVAMMNAICLDAFIFEKTGRNGK